jgi:hypothetical protein
MFQPDTRERLRHHLIEKARADTRIVAAATVGGSATGGDRWSDLDLTFGVASATPMETVLSDWTETMTGDFDAEVLFDLPRDSSVYRVFLLPGMLQVDLSFTPGADFGAHGPRFHLLFGEAIEHPAPSPEPSEHLFGLGIHHLVRATISIERGRLWQAEFWIHEARDDALTLACRRLGLDEGYGRGFDRLPAEVLDPLEEGLVGRLTSDELRRAVKAVLAALVREAPNADAAGRIETIISTAAGA